MKLYQILADVPKETLETGTPHSQKTTPIISRISKIELEAAYLKEPITFNAINKTTQLIMSTGYTLKGNTKDVKFFEDFFKTIGYTGGDITWTEILNRCFKYPAIYGHVPVELIKDSKGKIVDLDTIDPKYFDYAKSGSDIVLDKYGKPVGYTISYGYGTDFSDVKKLPIPKNIDMNSTQIYLPRDRVANIKMFTIGDGFYPIGLIEPSYDSISVKLKLSQSLSNAIWRHGFPIFVGKYGDVNHNPSPQNIQNLLNKLKDLKNTHEIAVPYWADISILESKTTTDLRKHLEYYIDQEVSGFGIPKAYVTGSGEACYSEDTKTLTENGFKYYWEIKKGEKIATYNPETRKLEYHIPTHTEIHNYKGKMHHYKSSVIDIMVTPEHKMYYRTARNDTWVKEKSKDIKQKVIKFKNSVTFDGTEQKEFVLPEILYDAQSRIRNNNNDYLIDMDVWLEFLGYFISEGYVGIKNNKYSVEISQVDKINLDKIQACLEKLPFKYTIKNGHGRHEGFRIHNKSLAIYLYEKCGTNSFTRLIPKEFLNVSSRQLQILFDALIVGDGSDFGTTGKNYATVSKELNNQVLELFIKLGYATSTDKQKQMYRVSGNKTHLEPRISGKHKTEEDYDGVVYCFEVPNHLFITERGGKIAIQGNTNRATLSNQTKIFELTTTQIINNITKQIEDKIMIPIARSHGMKTYPEIVWNPLNFSDMQTSVEPEVNENEVISKE